MFFNPVPVAPHCPACLIGFLAPTHDSNDQFAHQALLKSDNAPSFEFNKQTFSFKLKVF